MKGPSTFILRGERLEERTVLAGYFVIFGPPTINEPAAPGGPAYAEYSIGADNPSQLTASVDYTVLAGRETPPLPAPTLCP